MFLQAAIDLFLRRKTSHVGKYQYASHGGMLNGVSMSGAHLWNEAERQRIELGGYLVNAEWSLLNEINKEIGKHISCGVDVVDLGPGTVGAFRNKVMPLISVLESKTYIPVDESIGFLKELLGSAGKDIRITPFIDDFFSNEEPYCRRPALVCSFGSTISNIENPISTEMPEASLVHGLTNISKAAKSGALLVAFDSNQDGEKIKAYYKSHAMFQMNVFFRMASELPLEEFDPAAFSYEPLWIPESGQLAHIAVVDKDMRFTIAGHNIILRQGERLHLKNSYKFSPVFFERACALAGLEVINSWSNAMGACAYLLKLPAVHDSCNCFPVLCPADISFPPTDSSSLFRKSA